MRTGQHSVTRDRHDHYRVERRATSRHGPANGRDLTIATAVLDNGLYEVRVSNTGTGIAEDIAAHLFRPFITTKARGMGVGLSISRTIIKAHGGRLWGEPDPGGGSVFRFTLRALHGEAPADGT